MTKNLGKTDRFLRAGVGAILLFGSLSASTTVTMILMLVLGAVMLITSAIGFCPIFKAFDYNSAKPRA